MQNKKHALLIVNLGSPLKPEPWALYKYLTEFLNDPRVVDLPSLGRFLLVNGIIVPFRHRKSAKAYKELWTPEGAPLITSSKSVQKKLQHRLDPSSENIKVFLAMRYQEPSMEMAVKEIMHWQPDAITVLPLFPQYASATNGSVIDKMMRILRDSWVIPEVRFISQFWDHPKYLKAVASRAVKHDPASYDHILFSFHGVPERHVDKVYPDSMCKDHDCEQGVTEDSKFCYKAACFSTAHAVAELLSIDRSQYTVCFQSRLGRGWLEPFSDKVIKELAKRGKKKILVFSPAFVADCLETTIEIGEEYLELFQHNGGEELQLVESLNDGDDWVEALAEISGLTASH
jgi:ferrochelatase